jgi:hypothetical protein
MDVMKSMGSGIAALFSGGASVASKVAQVPALGTSVDHTMDTALNGIQSGGSTATSVGSSAASVGGGIMSSTGELLGRLNVAGSPLGAAGSIFLRL